MGLTLLSSKENQVSALTLTTPDGLRIFGWHILPLPVYAQHEEKLAKQPPTVPEDFNKSDAFQLLKGDPQSRLVLYCMLFVFSHDPGILSKKSL